MSADRGNRGGRGGPGNGPCPRSSLGLSSRSVAPLLRGSAPRAAHRAGHSFDASDRVWRPAPRSWLDPVQKDWLTRGGSLTAHLQTLGRVTVRVTRECVASAWLDERCCVVPRAPLMRWRPQSVDGGRPAALPGRAISRGPVWTREVTLSVDAQPMVVAHSVTPLAASHGIWQAMRRLRTRPLADLLYNDLSVSRSTLVSRPIGARHPLYRQVKAVCGRGMPLPPRLLARRSIFERSCAPLVVTECFLPALWRRLTGAPGS